MPTLRNKTAVCKPLYEPLPCGNCPARDEAEGAGVLSVMFRILERAVEDEAWPLLRLGLSSQGN